MQSPHPLLKDRIGFEQIDEEHRVPIDPVHFAVSAFWRSSSSASYLSQTSGPHSRSRRKYSSPPPSALKASAQSPYRSMSPSPFGTTFAAGASPSPLPRTRKTNCQVVLGPPEG